MDEIQRNAIKNYERLVTQEKDMVTTAGRYAEDADKLGFVWDDIRLKLDLQPGASVFDIGCGYGTVTQKLIELSRDMSLELHMMDAPEIVAAVERDLVQPGTARPRFYPGIFPDDFSAKAPPAGLFDRLLMYSVIHCTSQPLRLIEAGLRLLKPGGRFLVGDIPNMSRKGRFLASRTGRAFDARYKNISLDKAPVYASHHDFLAENSGNPLSAINDDMMIGLMKKYRDLGYDVYVLEQPRSLPFCFTREDLLIVRHD